MQTLVDLCLSASRLNDQGSSEAFITTTLHGLRTHLGMEVAFLSHFADGRRWFRHVDSAEGKAIVQVGGSDPLESSYCQRVVDGRLPELMTDATTNAEALTLPATLAIPVGAHLSVPIRLVDGTTYGTLCCFSSSADHTLNERDLAMMRVFAEVLAAQVERDLAEHGRRQEAVDRIQRVIKFSEIAIVYQPIVNVTSGAILGFEALSRFSADPLRPPHTWFTEAGSVGLGAELETHCIKVALQALDRLPPSQYISVNASPATIISGALWDTLAEAPAQRVVVEMTEHAVVERYGDLLAAVRPMQEAGFRFAIDDAGAGYASFRHILNLSPHMIKLDVSITRSVDTDHSRRALAAALSGFARETNCRLVAEGVETPGELETLRAIGFRKAQGYYLGRPMSLEHALQYSAHQPSQAPRRAMSGRPPEATAVTDDETGQRMRDLDLEPEHAVRDRLDRG